MKVFELLDKISGLDTDPDMPVIIQVGCGSYSKHRAEPKHVQVQRVCYNTHLRPCDAARCESAFMALVIW